MVSLLVRDGRANRIPVPEVYTDDRGEYRFGSLSPGRYYVSASGTPWYSEFGTDLSLHFAYATAFYKHASSPLSATPIDLKSGQEVTADLALSTVDGSRVTVSLVTTAPSQTNTDAAGEVVLRAEGEKRAPWVDRTVSLSMGGQQLQEVPAGRYEVEYRGIAEGGAVYDRQIVDAVSPAAEVKLAAKPLPIVTGTVKADAGTDLSHFFGVVALSNLEAGIMAPAQVKGAGEFSFVPALPGHYKVVFRSASYCLKALLVDGARQTGNTITVSPSHMPRLTFVVSDKVTEVKGILRHNGKPAPGELVVLVPKQRDLTAIEPKAYQTDSDGSFDFKWHFAG
jgi:hypothetical protein